MPSFVNSSDENYKVIHADWWAKRDDGAPLEICTIKKFSYGDRQYLAARTVRVGVAPGGGAADADAEVLIGEMNLAILKRGIVRWTDPKGRPVPITVAQVEALEERDAEFILQEINDFNPRKTRSPEEQDKFRGGTGNGNPEGISVTA
jgi:hypothetical protein